MKALGDLLHHRCRIFVGSYRGCNFCNEALALTEDGAPSSALLAEYCWTHQDWPGVCWAAYETPVVFLPLYSLCVSLDAVDGWLARRLGQTSRFGAWLDVAVDNLGRGMLWSLLFKWGWMVSALEWCVFMYNHDTGGAQWKNSFGSSPPLVRAVTANGFRTPLAVWVVGGLHCLPVWLYACQWGVLSHWLELPLWIQHVGMLLLVAGRVLALSAEVWCIRTHIEHLSSDELEETKS